jgi:predicted dehydrogenase
MIGQPLRAILIGAGQRGAQSYAPYALAHADQIQFVAVAEPNEVRRRVFAAQHSIAAENQFEDWQPLLDRPLMADVALICTQDWQHAAPALAAMRAGYHVLLEKPMANLVNDCRELCAVSRETERQLHICHVLRYTPHFQKMRELLQSGVLGEIIDVDHRENVAFYHMAHSYVRGNWRNKEVTSPMILAKCCHDFDILAWVLGQSPQKLSSFGELTHFRSDKAPADAPMRCLDGCPAADTCPFYAPNIYLNMAPFWSGLADTARGFSRWSARTYSENPNLIRALAPFVPPLKQITNYHGWPQTVLSEDPSPESLEDALRNGPYGRCVYHCDNNVVDHQVVMMQMENGATVTLTMQGHSHYEHRSTRIEGSHGRLMAEFGNGGAWIRIDEHRSDWHSEFDTSANLSDGHGGGDFRLMEYFVRSIREGNFEDVLQGTKEALQSHLLAFAAEDARIQAKVLGPEHWR